MSLPGWQMALLQEVTWGSVLLLSCGSTIFHMRTLRSWCLSASILRGEKGARKLPCGRCGQASAGCGAHHSHTYSVGWDSCHMAQLSPRRVGNVGCVPTKQREWVRCSSSNHFCDRDGWYMCSANSNGWGMAVCSELWRRILRLSPCLERIWRFTLFVL